MKAKTIELVPWKWQGVLVAGGTIEQFSALVKRDTGAEIDASPYSAGRAYVAYGMPWYLWVESIDDVASLAHEAFHIVSGVLQARGLKLSRKSEEAYTYTLSHIMTHAVNRKGWERVRV